jgi:hypothetical protein
MIFRNDRLRCANLTCDHDDLHISFQSAAACRFKQWTLCQCDDVACEMCARRKVLRADVRNRVASFGAHDCAFRGIQVAQKMKTGLVALSAGSLVVSRRRIRRDNYYHSKKSWGAWVRWPFGVGRSIQLPDFLHGALVITLGFVLRPCWRPHR